MLPNISVLMPARDAANTIKLAVKSTLFALSANDELIVGLHNCQDETLDILEEIPDARLKVIEISGATLGDALNNLIPLVSKECIGRMDADDICLPWRFFIQRRLVKSFDFVFTTALISYPRLAKVLLFPQYPSTLTTDLIMKLLVHTNPLVHPTMLARKVEIEKLLYRSVAGEDLDLWLRAILSGRTFIRLGIPGIIYRIQDGQLSRNPEYLNGWKDSAEINAMRNLCEIRANHTPLGFIGFLELLGLPTMKKMKSVYALIRKMRSSRY